MKDQAMDGNSQSSGVDPYKGWKIYSTSRPVGRFARHNSFILVDDKGIIRRELGGYPKGTFGGMLIIDETEFDENGIHNSGPNIDDAFALGSEDPASRVEIPVPEGGAVFDTWNRLVGSGRKHSKRYRYGIDALGEPETQTHGRKGDFTERPEGYNSNNAHATILKEFGLDIDPYIPKGTGFAPGEGVPIPEPRSDSRPLRGGPSVPEESGNRALTQAASDRATADRPFESAEARVAARPAADAVNRAGRRGNAGIKSEIQALDPAVDAKLSVLERTVSDLSNGLSRMQQMGAAANERRAQKAWRSFVDSKDEAGNLRRPHAERLKPRVAREMQLLPQNPGEALDGHFERAYENAIWSDSESRAELLKSREAERATEQGARRAALGKAKATGRTGGLRSVAVSRTLKPADSWRAELEQQWARLGGTG